MDHQRLGVADVGEMRGEAAGLDEFRPCLATALHAEGNDGATAPGHQLPAERVVGMVGQVRVQHPGDGVLALQDRSEEHTSELQSLMRISYAVFCLKKKKNKQNH